jgi:hypothetical protein
VHYRSRFGDDLLDQVVVDGIPFDRDLDALGLLIDLIQCAVNPRYALDRAQPSGQLDDGWMVRLQYIEYESFYVAHYRYPSRVDKLDLQY